MSFDETNMLTVAEVENEIKEQSEIVEILLEKKDVLNNLAERNILEDRILAFIDNVTILSRKLDKIKREIISNNNKEDE